MTTQELIKKALEEDMPKGDISSMYLFSNQESTGKFIAKEDGVLSGIHVCEQVFLEVDPTVTFDVLIEDGTILKKGDILAVVKGKTKSILMAERVGLNFLQRMSGVASKTKLFVNEIKDTHAKILDTRKTTPLLRALEKQAVVDGGGKNHRMSLSDMVMLKDNHLKASSSIQSAVDQVKKNISKDTLIEVEVESIAMFEEALLTNCDIIMLDNMSLSDMEECVAINHGKKLLEASGNMTLERIKDVALVGVDYISVGALTHSYHSLDISLKFE
ncbi:MAG: carboxylating nicotinate-nucleotide diphosphorylase [Candidatus Izemoplasmatales bacterium]